MQVHAVWSSFLKYGCAISATWLTITNSCGLFIHDLLPTYSSLWKIRNNLIPYIYKCLPLYSTQWYPFLLYMPTTVSDFLPTYSSLWRIKNNLIPYIYKCLPLVLSDIHFCCTFQPLWVIFCPPTVVFEGLKIT